MTKKFTRQFLVMLSIFAVTITARADKFVCDGIIYNTLEGSQCEVSGLDNSFSGSTLSFPQQVSNAGVKYDVVQIGNYAFQKSTKITSVTIPGNIKSVGYCAFEYCENLKEITLIEGVQKIDSYAFSGCTPTTITIPSTVTFLGSTALNCETLQTLTFLDGTSPIEMSNDGRNGVNVTSLKTLYYGRPFNAEGYNFRPVEAPNLKTITFGQAVTFIPDNYAYKCTALTEINFSGNETSIGKYAFQYCETLPKVTIPDACTSLGYCAFEYCYKLSDITLGNNLSYIDAYAFDGATPTTLIIPISVTYIGSTALNCETLQTLTFLDGTSPIKMSNDGRNGVNVTSLKTLYYGRPFNAEGNNFRPVEASNLKTITFGQAVTFIPDNYAYKCKNLTEINFSGNETSIGKYAFQYCETLPEVVIPDACTEIGYCAFEYCYKLAKITIGNKVSYIDSYAFDGCMPTTLSIPNSVTYIGNSALNCKNMLTLIIEDGNTPIEVQNDGWNGSGFDTLRGIYYGRPFNENGKNLRVNGAKQLEEIGFGEKVNFVPDSYATGCETLFSISFGGNETSIGKYAFQNCKNLRSVTVPDKVTSIGYCAFEYDEALKTVILSKSLQEIDAYAFDGCNNIKLIESLNPFPAVINAESAFASDCYKNAQLYVPEGALDAYKNANIWSKFFNIAVTGISSAIADGINVTVSGNTLYVAGAQQVSIYNAAGMSMYHGSDNEISLPGKGIYFIKVNNQVVKVAVND